jgi:glycosyltransferase involved in cell wall biosynthesis
MRRWLKEKVVAGDIEIIHNHGLWMMPNVYPGQIAKDTKVPLIVSPRGTLSAWAMASGSKIKRVFWPVLQLPALRTAACFHATALSEYEDIRRLGFAQPVAILPNGIDIPPMLSRRKAAQRTLLFLGRLHPVKGIDFLLRAWAAVEPRFSGWRLKIVGPDERGYKQDLQVLARDLRLQRVEFAGAIYGEEKWAECRNADLFVLPTHSENFGMAVAEALAAGTPVVVSKGAPWSGLQEKGAGWWIDIGVDPLVACLEGALSLSEIELASKGARGRDWMERDFSWRRIGEQTAETYAWLLGRRSRPDWVLTT